MSWRIQQFIRDYGKLILIGLLVFTGYAHITGGGGGAGRFMRQSTRWVYEVPVVGSLMRHGRNIGRSTYYGYSKGSRKHYGVAKRRGKHGRRSRRRR